MKVKHEKVVVKESGFSLNELEEIGIYLNNKVGNFDGTKPHLWNNFVMLFERIVEKKKWNNIEDDELLELLTARLSGIARTAWENWVLEDPCMIDDYEQVKLNFGNRIGGVENPWKLLMDFQMLQMGLDEDIGDFADKGGGLGRLRSCQVLLCLAGPGTRSVDTLLRRIAKRLARDDKADKRVDDER